MPCERLFIIVCSQLDILPPKSYNMRRRVRFDAESQFKKTILAGMAELADAMDLGSIGFTCAGSSPVTRINTNRTDEKKVRFVFIPERVDLNLSNPRWGFD